MARSSPRFGAYEKPVAHPADLAERTGVSRQTINALETGKYDPSLPLAFKLAAVFGKPIEEIFDPG